MDSIAQNRRPRDRELSEDDPVFDSQSFSRDFNKDPKWWDDQGCFTNPVWNGLGPNQCEKPLLSQCLDRHGHSIDTDKRIVACGDIHGDFTLLKKILLINKLIIYTENTWKWIGFDAILVLCGDLVDMHRKGGFTYVYPDNQEVDFSEWKIFMLLSELYNQGGDIIRLYGNHEIMVRYGEQLAYRTQKSKENDALRFPTGSTHLWEDPQGIYNQLMSNCGGGKAIVRINNWIFCHGGMNPDWIRGFIKNNSKNHEVYDSAEYGDWLIENYNRKIRQFMVSPNPTRSQYEEIIDDDGILWSRLHADHKSREKMCDDLVILLSQIFPINNIRVCQAHCPQPQDGHVSTPNKVFYNMTNIVQEEEHDGELGTELQVKKLSLPAVKCDYSQTFGRRRGRRTKPKCFNIPSINFACVPNESGTKYSTSESTNTLGRIWRIDCTMSKGLQYHRQQLRKFYNSDAGDHSELELEYMYRMYDLAVAPQNLEIHNSQVDSQNQETVLHVIGSNIGPFETIEEFQQNNPHLNTERNLR